MRVSFIGWPRPVNKRISRIAVPAQSLTNVHSRKLCRNIFEALARAGSLNFDTTLERSGGGGQEKSRC